ncbi:hypothetical protein HDU91_007209 [Kappamyces sp. JEL0680]|nr:hypothetical protein HDU91_007209 [Kappamyces sp. JEL0680]
MSATIQEHSFNPDDTQLQTIWWIVGYTVFIAVAWNVPILKEVLYPFKIFTVCCGFNVFASKIATVLVGIAMLLTLIYARNALTVLVTVLALGLFGFLWWYHDSIYLRYYILFLGVMSALYSLWDIIEDLITRKVNESDASQYSRICCGGALGPKFWGVIWFFISIVILAGAVALALYFFKSPY